MRCKAKAEPTVPMNPRREIDDPRENQGNGAKQTWKFALRLNRKAARKETPQPRPGKRVTLALGQGGINRVRDDQVSGEIGMHRLRTKGFRLIMPEKPLKERVRSNMKCPKRPAEVLDDS